MPFRILPGTSTATFPDRLIDGNSIKWIEPGKPVAGRRAKLDSVIHHIPKSAGAERVALDFEQLHTTFPLTFEPCTQWNMGVEPGIDMLINPKVVVKVQKIDEKNYEVYFVDGDTIKLSVLPISLSTLI